jgi:hypothetical protein
MPQCPTCKAQYEIGQRYCKNCESYLLNPEEGDYFCPQCGIRVAPRQEVCHKCSAALGKAAAAPSAPSEPAPQTPEPHHFLAGQVPPPRRLPLWAPVALIAAGIIILILIAVIFTQQRPQPPSVAEIPSPPAAGTPPPPATVTPPPQAAAPSTPAAATPAPEVEVSPAPAKATPAPSQEETVQEGVRETLNNLRKAQLEENIILFMSCYSYLYPNLEKKRKQAQDYWKKFHFMALEFSLDEIKPVGPESLLARVTWTMQVQDRRNQEFDSSSQTFDVAMSKELGAWRIRSLKDVTDYE